ncbi:MAG: hypothetical protein JNM56_10455 [Planctomycetia bacterium]|nr:hypothetical protein [Planctomycetia bacterium]
MADSELLHERQDDGPPVDPWHIMIGAGAASLLFLPLSYLPSAFPAVLALLGGLCAAGFAISLRPRFALLIAAGGGVAVVFAVGMKLAAAWEWKADWDSARMVVGVLAGIAFVASFLVGLPWMFGQLFVWQSGDGGAGKRREQQFDKGRLVGQIISRTIVSLLVVIHFTAIVSSVMSVPSPGRDSSWLAQSVGATLRPYIEFSYLVNAYRFYSPEPGPPSLLWFHLTYADGTSRWVKVPNPDDPKPDPLGQEYTRRLSIGESTNQLLPLLDVPDIVKQRRITAGQLHDIPLLNHFRLDYPDLPAWTVQYRPPMEASRNLVSDYARHIAAKYPSEKDPNAEVTAVKVYRVVHRMLEPREMADPENAPNDPTTYWPYFQGEFTKNGDLKDPNDPFLYWLIPIFKEPRTPPPTDLKNLNLPPVASSGGYLIRDCLETHARMKTDQGGPKP